MSSRVIFSSNEGPDNNLLIATLWLSNYLRVNNFLDFLFTWVDVLISRWEWIYHEIIFLNCDTCDFFFGYFALFTNIAGWWVTGCQVRCHCFLWHMWQVFQPCLLSDWVLSFHSHHTVEICGTCPEFWFLDQWQRAPHPDLNQNNV